MEIGEKVLKKKPLAKPLKGWAIVHDGNGIDQFFNRKQKNLDLLPGERWCRAIVTELRPGRK